MASRLKSTLAGTPCTLTSSDMQRTRETAEIIAGAIGVTPTLSPALREWNGHLACTRTGTEPEWPQYASDDAGLLDWRPVPKGENWREFYARVRQWLDVFLMVHDTVAVPVIVLHGGSLSNLVALWLGLPVDALSDRMPFATSPGAVSVLRTNRFGKQVIGFLGDRTHLVLARLVEMQS